MKFLTTAVLLIVSSVSGNESTQNLRADRELTSKLGECEVDCDKSRDCAGKLKCASNFGGYLEANGYDRRKAYCGDVGDFNEDVCFDLDKLVVASDAPSTVPSVGIVDTRPSTDASDPLLGECEADCDSNDDCQDGLICADTRKGFLLKNRLDPRKAYCDTNIGGIYDEVCFDPKKVERLLKECEFDCDVNEDCEAGLLCADDNNERFLAKSGLDRRTAYCGAAPKGSVDEVCYDPSKVVAPTSAPVAPTFAPTISAAPTELA